MMHLHPELAGGSCVRGFTGSGSRCAAGAGGAGAGAGAEAEFKAACAAVVESDDLLLSFELLSFELEAPLLPFIQG